MKLIEASKGRFVVEMNSEERFVINGIFSMIDALQEPGWEDSTGQADLALTPEQFHRVSRAWTKLLDGPEGKKYFGPKSET